MTGITFTLHKGPEDKSQLWTETQNVKLDADGRYTVLLGATKPDGVPADLFISGEAQWLGIHIEDRPDQPRVLLVSVPYALKAAEAETLAGHAASEFVTADKLASVVEQRVAQGPATATAKKQDSPAKGSALSSTATNFVDTTTNQVVLVTQNGTGNALVANAGTGNGVQSSTTNAAAYGVVGTNSATTGIAIGVRGSTSSSGGIAVYGVSTPTTGTGTGVKGVSSSPSGYGVFGQNTSTTGTANGFRGSTASTSGVAIYGTAISATGQTKGLVASAASPNGIAAVFQNTATGGKLLSGQAGASSTEVFSVDGYGSGTFTGKGQTALIGDVGCGAPSAGISFGDPSGCQSYALLQQNDDVFVNRPTGGTLHFRENNTDEVLIGSGGVLYTGPVTTTGLIYISHPGYQALDVHDGSGVFEAGLSASLPANFSASNDAFSATGADGTGKSAGDAAIFQGGASDTYFGGNGMEVYGGDGVNSTYTGGAGIISSGGSPKGLAAYFLGNISVSGSITAGTKDFKIDHPLDPANKFLYHASVESSEMMNIYSGNITTNGAGVAVVRLPEWFEALNADFRYQLTVVGEFAQAIVGSKIAMHQFTIKTNKPNVEVSWQVTAVRHDAYAAHNPLDVEVAKDAAERGLYLHPEYFGATADQQVSLAHNPTALKHYQAHIKAAAAKAKAGN
ncbi:hypothetical protein [Candidatus Korobacter versatilis]|nr:hypothetical protein [Candidatus Koribacter versatilis]